MERSVTKETIAHRAVYIQLFQGSGTPQLILKMSQSSKIYVERVGVYENALKEHKDENVIETLKIRLPFTLFSGHLAYIRLSIIKF